ncbi:guanylate kinase [Cryobacterium sp. TMT1-3]|uniref:Guanylate kinase n=1 Tax=Cryobacterium luteum TaxID=1424661 RepID=A0A1H8CYY1_9MICO|nr:MULTISPECIES: guanylate kinase [Cryobacterium]TFB91830.1 guanylate kinase [Cryobacterium luteum]TFC31196.1 guanylate kinase [Cryobacterium sp. TMT1-3]SEN00165.1 guanylate kinase [Cryobacterium luteum]
MVENRPTPPEVDRVAASRAAVAARRARAKVKAEVASGERTALEVLAAAITDPVGVEGRLRVTELLVSIPAIGVTKMQRIINRLEISPSKRLGGLGRHQRDRLRDFLSERPVLRHGVADSKLIVLAGPTAVGKGTVAGYIRENYPDVLLSVSATTRAPRPGETEGLSYYFVSDEQFDRMIEDGELLEWATVHNAYRYGTPRAPVDAAIAAGNSVLLEIDLQGARAVRRAMPEARLVFLLPPSWDELVRRLIGRGTEDAAEQARRLETAKLELAAQGEFDYQVINHDVGDAAREVVDLMEIRAASSMS